MTGLETIIMVDPVKNSEEINIGRMMHKSSVDSGVVMDSHSHTTAGRFINSDGSGHLRDGSFLSHHGSDHGFGQSDHGFGQSDHSFGQSDYSFGQCDHVVDRSGSSGIQEDLLMDGVHEVERRCSIEMTCNFFLEEEDEEEDEGEDEEKDLGEDDPHMLFQDSGNYGGYGGGISDDDDDELGAVSTSMSPASKPTTPPIDIPSSVVSSTPRRCPGCRPSKSSPRRDSTPLGSSPCENLMISWHRTDSYGRMVEQALRTSARIIAHKKCRGKGPSIGGGSRVGVKVK